MTDPLTLPPTPGVPLRAEEASRLYEVTHTTTYRYDEPVYQSAHSFRLHPVHDRSQEVLDHRLWVSVPGRSRELVDVFGNHTVHYEISDRYTELVIEAKSVVRVHSSAGFAPPSPLGEATIPIPWMPWQSQMMMPYLLPPELEQSQLYELSDYARFFVYRNGHDLVASLLDMTNTLKEHFQYVPGSTHLDTTPFEVYRNKRGVCQDFANLLICLARLERVPARYRVGYLHTGGDYANKIQAEASHAWVEVYLPSQGWKGLDPTNGVSVAMDHIRVAVGRNYRDATPTAGVIKAGGGGESLSVSVKVEVLEGG